MNTNCNSLQSSPRPVMSGDLATVLEEVKDFIEFDSFDEAYIAQAEEICLIIAEMYVLPQHSAVQISGNKLTAEAVKTIYSMLTHEDIISVMDSFESVAHKIKYKKTYLRTALYNEVFERNSRVINDVRTDIGEYVSTRREQIEEKARRERWQPTR